MNTNHGCSEFQELTKGINRRSFIKSVMAVGGGLVIAADPGMTYSLAQPGDAKGIVVTLTMRGGMDGIMAVPLLGSQLLQGYRPRTSLTDTEIHNLDGVFGLHKNLAGFRDLFHSKELAIVHAAGTPIGTRSHFDDQRAVEFAAYDAGPTQTGWQSRYLSAAGHNEILSGFSASRNLPASLNGSAQSVAFQALADIELVSVGRSKQDYRNLLNKMHGDRNGIWSSAARTSLAASENLSGLSPSSETIYPEDIFSQRLRLLATMLKAGVPIKTANIEFQGDLDVHDDAGIREGVMAQNFKRLNDGVMAFRIDVGQIWKQTVLVTITEFGRRLMENASAGLDHGWASAMFVIGGNVKGGQVVAKWPGIEKADLHNGDLRVTTDYRDVLSVILQDAGGLSAEGLRQVFPNYKSNRLDLIRSLA